MSIWQLLHVLLRALEALVGVFCVSTAILLYPDQEGNIQSALEDFWVRVDDYQRLALTRHAAFMTQLAQLETHFLDRLFGPQLMSARALAVSFGCCVGTFSATVVMLGIFDNEPGASVLGELFLPLLAGSIAIGGASIFIRSHQTVRWIIVFLAFLFMTGYFVIFIPGVAVLLAIVVVILAFAGFVCDVIFIVLTRRLVRWAGQMTSSWNVIAVIMGNLLLALFLVGPLFIFAAPHQNVFDKFALTLIMSICIALTNVFDTVLALLFVLFATTLIIHRALWPLLTRSLFRMQAIGTKGRRGIFITVGIALLDVSVFRGKFPELLKGIIRSLAG